MVEVGQPQFWTKPRSSIHWFSPQILWSNPPFGPVFWPKHHQDLSFASLNCPPGIHLKVMSNGNRQRFLNFSTGCGSKSQSSQGAGTMSHIFLHWGWWLWWRILFSHQTYRYLILFDDLWWEFNRWLRFRLDQCFTIVLIDFGTPSAAPRVGAAAAKRAITWGYKQSPQLPIPAINRIFNVSNAVINRPYVSICWFRIFIPFDSTHLQRNWGWFANLLYSHVWRK